MAGAPMLTALPTIGWQKKGFDEEEQRRDTSRAEKRKQLQELADRASAEGRELSINEWFNMAQSEVGIGGLLSGAAPSSAVLESIRSSSNVKAQEVASKRQYDQAIRTTDLTNKMRDHVGELVRSGVTDPLELRSRIAKTHGEDAANMHAETITSTIQRVNVTDYAEGVKLGGSFRAAKDAEDFIKGNPGISARMSEGIRRGAASVESTRLEKLDELALRVGASGYVNNDAELHGAVQSFLPPELQTQEYTERFRRQVIAASRLRANNDRINTTNASNNAYASWGPTAGSQRASLEVHQVEKIAKAVEAAGTAAASMHDRAIGLHVAALDASAKGKKPSPFAIIASEIIKSYDLDEDVRIELVAAAQSGNEAEFQKARANAIRNVRPLVAVVEASKLAARAAAGDLTGSPSQMYGQVSTIGESISSGVMLARGQRIAELRARGSLPLVKTQVDGAVAKVSQAIIDTRDVLLRSGRFSAGSQELQQYEAGAIRRMLDPLSVGSGIAIDELAASVMSRLPPPQAIEAKQGDQEIYERNVAPGFGAAGVPTPWANPRPAQPPQGDWPSRTTPGPAQPASRLAPPSPALLAWITEQERQSGNSGPIQVNIGGRLVTIEPAPRSSSSTTGSWDAAYSRNPMGRKRQ